jgi:hypothetical protein
MKRLLKIAIVVLVVTLSATLYVIFVPPRAGYVGTVSVSLRGYQTNSFGQREILVAITNAGPQVLQLSTGTEIWSAGRWEDSSGLTNHTTITLSADPILRPGNERIVAVPDPQAGASWRVFAFCHINYAPDWKGRLGFIIDGYVLKRRPFEKFHSPEISQ